MGTNPLVCCVPRLSSHAVFARWLLIFVVGHLFFGQFGGIFLCLVEVKIFDVDVVRTFRVVASTRFRKDPPPRCF